MTFMMPFRLRPNPIVYRWVAIGALIVSLVTTGQDYLSSVARQGSYYFTESLVFSSFWWIFPALLWTQLRRAGRLHSGSVSTRLWWMVWPIAAHLLVYPVVVDALAMLTLGHGFRWAQTLRYGISEYAVVVLAGYTLPLLAAVRSGRPGQLNVPDTAPARAEPDWAGQDAAQSETTTGMLDTIMAKEGTRTMIVPVRDILLITAASPYVRLHAARRQFLVTETLRSLSLRLDPTRFYRIHKSAIVQLDAVVEMRSRQNGDYDLILADGSVTRLSRSYVPSFRKAIAARAPSRLVNPGTTPA